MSSEVLPPAKRPCGSCPYRKDIPSGVWAAEEYEKLPGFDNPQESERVFMCHQQNGHLCAGWVGVHDMDNMLSLRIAGFSGRITEETFEAVLDYTTDVELFEPGQAAADHGMDHLADPPVEAAKVIQKLMRTDTPIPRTLG